MSSEYRRAETDTLVMVYSQNRKKGDFPSLAGAKVTQNYINCLSNYLNSGLYWSYQLGSNPSSALD